MQNCELMFPIFRISIFFSHCLVTGRMEWVCGVGCGAPVLVYSMFMYFYTRNKLSVYYGYWIFLLCQHKYFRGENRKCFDNMELWICNIFVDFMVSAFVGLM